MSFNHKKTITIITSVVVIGGIFLYMQSKDSGVFNGGQKVSEEEIRGGTVDDVLPSGGEDAGVSSEESDMQRYTNTKYGFSFVYPKGFTIGSFKEGYDGEIVLVQDQERKQGFQVYIIPFDEPGPLTLSRIKQDLPDLRIDNPQVVVIAEGSVEALLFESQSESYDRSREIWFLHGGFMYQVTTRAGADDFIGPVMESWKFE